MMRRLSLLFAGALALIAGCAPARPVEAPVDDSHDAEPLTPETSPIGLRKSMVADEYFWLRAKVLEGEAPPPFLEAFNAMHEIRSDLASDPTSYEDLEVPLGNVRRASELMSVYTELSLVRDVGGKPVQLRARALRLAKALEQTEGVYRNGPYRDHDVEIQRAAKEINARLLPNVETILRAIEHDMALPGMTRPIVVTLVGDAPYPGIFAADARGRSSASFVRVHGLDGGALCETVLHESLHAIDELTVRSATAMNALRKALAQHGMLDDDPNVEMAVNTVTFAEAASLVKRFVDPNHKPMGESGFYTLFPAAPAIVAAWDKHIAGAPMNETMDEIAKAVAAPN